MASDISRRGLLATGVAAVGVTLSGSGEAHEDDAKAAQRKAYEIAEHLGAAIPGKWVVSYCPDSNFVLIHRDTD